MLRQHLRVNIKKKKKKKVGVLRPFRKRGRNSRTDYADLTNEKWCHHRIITNSTGQQNSLKTGYSSTYVFIPTFVYLLTPVPKMSRFKDKGLTIVCSELKNE